MYCLDFGYSEDPTALVKVKMVNDRIYAKELLYKTGIGDYELCGIMKSLGITPEDIIIADYGAGGDLRISNIRRMYQVNPDYVFNIFPAIKGEGSIKAGISRIKECKVFATENSSNLWNEYQEYKWALDANGIPTDRPIDKYNHIMDAIRYGVLSKGSIW